MTTLPQPARLCDLRGPASAVPGPGVCRPRLRRRLPRRYAPGVDPCGERGEVHTCAYSGPLFAHPLPVRPGAVVERDGLVFADLLLGALPGA